MSAEPIGNPIDTPSSIGLVMESLNISARAIRLYEERGLISVSRDRSNRRMFDVRTRQKLEVIGRLRRAGLGLDEIREIISHDRDRLAALACAALGERRRQVEAELRDVEDAERWFTPAGSPTR